MALVINILTPLTIPSFSVVAVPGTGNFVAGTYTFALHLDATAIGMIYGASHLSNYVEATIVLQANDAVRFTWGNLDTRAIRGFISCLRDDIKNKGYLDYIGTENGFNYSSGFSLTSYPTGVTITQNSWQIRSTSFANYEPTNFYFGLRPDKGFGKIQVISDVDFSYLDIMNAIRTSSMIKGEDYIDMGNTGIITTYSLDTTGCTGSKTFTISGAILYFTGGIAMANTLKIVAGANLSTTTIFSSKHGGYGQSFILNNPTFIQCAFVSIKILYTKNGRLYGESMGNTYVFNGTGSIITCYLHGNYGGFNILQSDCLVVSGSITLPANAASGQPTRQKTIGSYIQSYSTAGASRIFSNQDFILSNSTYQVFHTGDNIGSNYFLDCTFKVGVNFIMPPIEFIYTYAINYGNSRNYYGNTVSINITDELGNNIQNANVKLYDKNNNLMFDINTNSSGNIVTQNIYWYYIELIAQTVAGIENNNNCIRINLNPFTLIITKIGYKVYKTKLNIVSKQSLSLVLDKQIIYIDQEQL